MSKKVIDSDVEFIASLTKILKDNDLTELDIHRIYGADDELEIRLSQKQEAAAPIVVSPPPSAAPPQQAAAPAPAAQPAGTTEPAVDDPASNPNAVLSPMVGTAYLAAEPGASPFVSLGEQVSEGQTLLIIEAMKTMNHIPSPKSGTVKRILVENGALIEFGTPLMIVE